MSGFYMKCNNGFERVKKEELFCRTFFNEVKQPFYEQHLVKNWKKLTKTKEAPITSFLRNYL